MIKPNNLSVYTYSPGEHLLCAQECGIIALIAGAISVESGKSRISVVLLPQGAQVSLTVQESCEVFELPWDNQPPSETVVLPDCPDHFAQFFRSAHALLSGGSVPGLLSDQTVSLVLQWLEHLLPKKETSPVLSNYRLLAENARKIIHEEYAADLTLESVADRLYVNTCYLSTIFHRHTGTTFRSYLRSVRLEQARKLVVQTNMQITDIAIQVGFNSSAYLIRSFREAYHTTPMALRQQKHSE